MPRPVTESHPFIDFTLQIGRITPRLWFLLGQMVSKMAHISKAPLLPETASQMLVAWLVKGAKATTAIEGNTLTEDQVRAIQEGTANIPDSRAYQVEEVKNVLDAMNMLVEGGAQKHITHDIIHNTNSLILRGLKLRQGVFAGRIRQGGVSAGTYLAPDHADVQDLLDRFVEWVDGPNRLQALGIDELAEVVLRAE